MEQRQTDGVLRQLTDEREWTFSVPSAEGEEIECHGSEPETENEVAVVIRPVNDAELLYERTIQILHDSPELSEEEWEEVTATNKALIAAQHLHHWNVYDLISEEQIEEAKRRLIENELN